MPDAVPMPEAARLDTLTAEDFAPHAGSAFALALPGGEALALALRDVTPLGLATSLYRRPFSLVFAGPAAPPLPQQIYSLHHAALGALNIFLVPIGATPAGREYQAVFG